MNSEEYDDDNEDVDGEYYYTDYYRDEYREDFHSDEAIGFVDYWEDGPFTD